MQTRSVFVAILVSTLVGGLLTACVTTELPAQAVNDFTDGQVYYLPRSEFGIEVERELTACNVRIEDDATTAAAWVSEQIRALETVRTELKDKREAGQSFHCDANRVGMNTTFGSELVERVRGNTSARGTCGSKTDAELEAENEAAVRFLVASFLDDPRFTIGNAEAVLSSAGFQPPAAGQEDLEKLLAVLGKIPMADPNTRVDLQVDVRAKIEPFYLADMDHAYTLDYAGTRRSLKKTEYAVETYDNGTLKSINAGLEDKTGDVIRASLSGVLKVAAAAGGIPFPAVAAVPLAGEVPAVRSYERFVEDLEKKVPQLCTEQVRTQLAEREMLRKELGELPARIRQRTAAVAMAAEALTAAEEALAAAKAAGKSGDALKPFEKAVADKKAAHTTAEAALEAQKKLAEPAASKLARVREALTTVNRNHFRPDSAPAELEIGGSWSTSTVWFDDASLMDYCTGNTLCEERNGRLVPRPLLAWTSLYLAPKTPTVQVKAPTTGIVYRQPARGLLIVCTHEVCLDGQGSVQVLSDHLVSISQVDVPQLGVLARLPLTNKGFQNNSLKASFSPAGTLMRVEYSSNARAVAQAETFSESADSLLEFAKATRERDKANLENESAELAARAALVQKQLELEQALKALEDFRAGGATSGDEGEEDGEDDEQQSGESAGNET